jgi:hypothetical protein
MERITRNLECLSASRGLSPIYLDEVRAAAQEAEKTGESARYFLAVDYILAALREKRLASLQGPEDAQLR